MEHVVVVKGHLVSPTTLELDEPVLGAAHQVDVILRLDEPRPLKEDEESLTAFRRGLPLGGRSNDDIDEQIGHERDSWT